MIVLYDSQIGSLNIIHMIRPFVCNPYIAESSDSNILRIALDGMVQSALMRKEVGSMLHHCYTQIERLFRSVIILTWIASTKAIPAAHDIALSFHSLSRYSKQRQPNTIHEFDGHKQNFYPPKGRLQMEW